MGKDACELKWLLCMAQDMMHGSRHDAQQKKHDLREFLPCLLRCNVCLPLHICVLNTLSVKAFGEVVGALQLAPGCIVHWLAWALT